MPSARMLTGFWMRNAGEWSPASITTVVLGVLAFTAFLVWRLWRVYRSMELAERDPRYLRRLLLYGVVLYGGGAVFGTLLVVTGKEPIQSLIGLPIAALFVWVYLNVALRVKVPPK